jgi:hypothetical protein
MNQSLEDVIYGNPTSEHLEILQMQTPYDYLLPKIFETVCPSNISTLTQDELDVLVEYQKQFNYLPKSTIKRYEAYDNDLIKSAANFIYNRHNGYDLRELFNEIITSTKPILLKLKYKYQRPRPYVLAAHYKKSVFPVNTITAISPSFPSGHVFQMALLVETLGSMEPIMYNDLQNLMIDISEQRLFYRLHYPSDNDVAMQFAKIICQSKEWTKKYNI